MKNIWHTFLSFFIVFTFLVQLHQKITGEIVFKAKFKNINCCAVADGADWLHKKVKH